MHAHQATSAAAAVVTTTSPGVPASHGVTSPSRSLTAGVCSTSDLTPSASHVVPKPPASVTLLPASSSPASVFSAPGCTPVTKLAPVSQTPHLVTVAPKMTAPQQGAPPRASRVALQLPANFQIPPGTVLIRSSNGQLMLVSQQALARAQAQVQNASARPPISSSAPTVQICSIQTPGNQLVANSTVKTAPISLPLTPVSQTLTFQSSSSIKQSTSTSNNVVKASSVLPSNANTAVPMPTVVRICPTSQTAATSQGTATVIIRASVPSASAVTFSCTSPVATLTPSPSVGITATPAVCSGASSVTVLPVGAPKPAIIPVTINTCTSLVVPTPTVSPSQAPAVTCTLPMSARPSNINVVKTFVPTNVLPAITCASTIKLTTSNICVTTTAASPVIVSSIKPAAPVAASPLAENNRPAQLQANVPSVSPSVISCKTVPPNKPQSIRPPNATEVLDNVKKCKNFLATLIKLASSGPRSPIMGQNVKNLVKNLLDSKLEAEEFTTKLYKELKSSPQPYLVPFLKKSLPSLRRLMPNSQDFILQCGHQNPPPATTATNSVSFVKITPTTSIQTANTPGSMALGNVKIQQISPAQSLNTLKPVSIKQVVVQQPSSGIVKHVTTLPPNPVLNLNKPGEKEIPLNALIRAAHLPPASVLKQVTLPGNKVVSLKASPLPIKENSTVCFREEDDINDVTSMAGVNLSEESACILATNSELVGAVIRSCKDEPFLFTSALQSRILDIGKRHDIKELNSDVMNLVSHATQERLRGLIEKLTVAAQHRSTNYKRSDRFIQSSDVRAQLKFLEQLEHLEKQRKNEEEREMLLRAAKSRSNKEDPEQLRLKQKAKEMQQLELEQIQYREANLTALAAIGPRRKRPLDSPSLQNVLEESRASGSSVLSIPKSVFVPRIIRVNLRDLIFCMEQERRTCHSLSLYQALLK
ncbi:transcription initiation factor TFIID subunit 4B [Pseudophryne corroboree]|uniref:transcription initiation factor TFIID subunit 4B n=1 Tax=Pseudophryne corroboree TaxID=495146 RepID=UPI0030815DA9